MVWVAAAGGESEEGLLKDVVFYALDSRQESILWDVKPAFVVVYDPDVTFVRQLEVQPPSCAQAENQQYLFSLCSVVVSCPELLSC